MKKSYKIEVDCANCANLMEHAASKIKGVASVTVNFMMQKMHIQFESGYDPDAVMQQVRTACKKAASDCDIFL